MIRAAIGAAVRAAAAAPVAGDAPAEDAVPEPLPDGTTYFTLYDVVQDDYAIFNPPLINSQTYGNWELDWDGRWNLKFSGALRHYWNQTPQVQGAGTPSDDGGGGQWYNETGI